MPRKGNVNKIASLYQKWTGGMLLLLLGIMSFKTPYDPDLGWHIMNGRYTLAHMGPQRGDVFSWTMPGYPWVSHEWLTEVIMAFIERIGGLWGLSIVFALLVAFVFWLASIAGKRPTVDSVIVAIIGVTISWPIIGVRPQMITLLGVALILYVLFRWRESRGSRLIYWIPAIFMIWANLHAGFAAGFAVVGVFILAEIIRLIFLKPSRLLTDPLIPFPRLVRLGLITFVGGGLATLINPYGWRIYEELVVTLTKTDVLNRIAEWLPVDFTARGSYNLIIGGILVLVLLCAARLKVDYTKLTLAIVFFIVATTSWRHLPLFAITSLPFVSEQLTLLSHRRFAEIFRSAIPVVALVTVVAVAGWWHVDKNAKIINDSRLIAQASDVSYDAVEYLKNHNLPGNMLNEYNWGGYLIWHYPEKKVFIDGRMAIWDDGTTKIFDEFSTLMGEHRATILSKLDEWNIGVVFVYANRSINNILSLERETWEQRYRDNMTVIWQRKNHNPLIQ